MSGTYPINYKYKDDYSYNTRIKNVTENAYFRIYTSYVGHPFIGAQRFYLFYLFTRAYTDSHPNEVNKPSSSFSVQDISTAYYCIPKLASKDDLLLDLKCKKIYYDEDYLFISELRKDEVPGNVSIQVSKKDGEVNTKVKYNTLGSDNDYHTDRLSENEIAIKEKNEKGGVYKYEFSRLEFPNDQAGTTIIWDERLPVVGCNYNSFAVENRGKKYYFTLIGDNFNFYQWQAHEIYAKTVINA